MENIFSIELVAIIILAILAIYLIKIYNTLVEYSNQAKNGFSQIDVQLKRRYDLIPNLVNTAKGYMQHERQTLEAVIDARNEASKLLEGIGDKLQDPGAMGALTSAENTLAGALGGLRIAVEAYPDLKASSNMMQLSEELTSTENKIAFSRQAYNDAVNTYNTYRQGFPPILFAGLFGHGKDFAFLNFEEGEKLQQAPDVSF